MPLNEGEWRLSYSANGVHPGASFIFGTWKSRYYLLDDVEIKDQDITDGDTPLPREDGLRHGQDFSTGATLTFEIGVDTVDASPALRERHGANLDAVSRIKQAWDARAVRDLTATPAVLSTMQGGRERRWYGRPRKCEKAASKLTRQGYTPLVASFTASHTGSFSEVEQSIRVDMAPPPHRGIKGPLTAPLMMVGEGAVRTPGEIVVAGNRPSWPVITIVGPIAQPTCELVGRWKLKLNLSLKAGERVVIDPRPWVRTVKRGSASVAGLITRGSPLLEDLLIPPGRQDFVLRGTDVTATSYMTVAWRDAWAYM
ncbi:hypothetical protein SAM9427_36645 (plasmid) [Streptomyces sp. ETH9427]|uniref:hypothetical protein n=1 Tax=Streptomyces sp. E1N211 TaxID=1851876 RepID=UPI000E0B0A40|nr:hypothetical protein [Streptomyces sp. E1N211]AXI91306.1 hypothetical protein SAM9427_36645 [Streptomyces sp. ETH9427]